MKVNISDVSKEIFAGGDVPKERFSEIKTEKYSIPIYANAEKDEGLYGYTDEARVFEECVTVAARGTIGFCAKRTAPFLPVVRLITVIPNQDLIITDYLYYMLCNIKTKGSGTSIPQLTVPDIKKYSFNLVDINEQKEIVGKIKRIEKVIALKKREIEQLEFLIKARFVEMFGDFDLSHKKPDWVEISEIGVVVGGATPKTNILEYWDGEHRWISPAELENDSGIIYDSVRKITTAGVESCSLQELPVGTVILSSRAPIGKLAIAGNIFYCNQGFKNIVCGERVVPRYLYSLLLYNTKYLNSLGRGATFKEISKNIVERICIPVPDLKKQKAFDVFVTQVDKSKFMIKKTLNAA